MNNSNIEVVADQLMVQVGAGESHEDVAKDFLRIWGECSPNERGEFLAAAHVVAAAAEFLEVAYEDPLSELADRLFLAGLEIKNLVAEIQTSLVRNEVPKAEDVSRLQNLVKCLALATENAQAMGRRSGMSLAVLEP